MRAAELLNNAKSYDDIYSAYLIRATQEADILFDGYPPESKEREDYIRNKANRSFDRHCQQWRQK